MRCGLRDGDRSVALCLTLLGLIMRLIAFPVSLWEWDEVLFARALQKFDVGASSPHPPGFPVFVLLGRLAYSLVGDEHLAYGAISLVFGSLLPGSLFYFYREVFQNSTVALAGAVIGSFAPSVWVHGGAARSDGSALTLGIIGLTLAIRGLRWPRSLLAAGALVGISTGVRVILGPLVAPALAVGLMVRLREGRWRLAVATLGLSIAGVLSWYVPLVSHTGWHLYQRVVREHGQYILTVESVFGAAAGTLSTRFHRFFFDIWGTPRIAWLVTLFALTGAALLVLQRRWRTLGWLGTCFLPVMAFTFMVNSPAFAPLYALPYIPLFAGLAGFGAITAPRMVLPQSAFLATTIGRVLVAVIVVALIHWTYPIVEMFRREESPLVRALRHVGTTLDPDRDVLRYDPVFFPHVIFYLPHIKMRRELPTNLNLIDPLVGLSPTWNLTAEAMTGTAGRWFHWSSARGAERLRPLSPNRYFDIYVTGPLPPRRTVFLSGWSERDGKRLMDRVSRTALLLSADVMILHLRLRIPESVGRRTIVLRLDEVEIDRFVAHDQVVDRTLTVRTEAGRLWSVLTIETHAASTPSHGAASEVGRRDALTCEELTWSVPQPSNPSIVSDDQFRGRGWHAFEGDARNGWWWIEAEGVVHLPPLGTNGQLDMRLLVPPGNDGRRSTVTLAIAGRVLDRFSPPAGLFSKAYRIPVSVQKGAALDLTLSATPVLIPGDPQPRGILVAHVGWVPVAEP